MYTPEEIIKNRTPFQSPIYSYTISPKTPIKLDEEFSLDKYIELKAPQKKIRTIEREINPTVCKRLVFE